MPLLRSSLEDPCCFGALGLSSCFVFACATSSAHVRQHAQEEIYRLQALSLSLSGHSQDNHRRNSKDNLHQNTEKYNCAVRIYCMLVCPLTLQAIAAAPKSDFAHGRDESILQNQIDYGLLPSLDHVEYRPGAE